ncbi:hypothetical protein [Herpetosiphon geysericola]|uniref:Uncharacterized protein n=1 Tax=Herpetosiphon geysericola TaxID=70996 RepID=A0A0P6YDF0_9CHLR|nr:hypothetical protein [Herpetosiphon geysericola]KPL83037.1 hypothetical protein SE18_19535 [Herpetosiphon geysericola]
MKQGLLIPRERRSAKKFIRDQLRIRNLTNYTRDTPHKNALIHIHSNAEFWTALEKQTLLCQQIYLDSFQLVDWFPRSPGYYYTDEARRNRFEAAHHVYTHDESMYDPWGKMLMMEGGVGCIRLAPQQLGSNEVWFYTATSDGMCHSGIPLVIPNHLLQNSDIRRRKVSITGHLCFKTMLNMAHHDHLRTKRVTQAYIYVDELIDDGHSYDPVLLTPMAFFTQSSKGIDKQHLLNPPDFKQILDKGMVVYRQVVSDDNAELDATSDWMQSYVASHEGHMITDFDQQRPAFGIPILSLDEALKLAARESRIIIQNCNINESVITARNDGWITMDTRGNF